MKRKNKQTTYIFFSDFSDQCQRVFLHFPINYGLSPSVSNEVD